MYIISLLCTVSVCYVQYCIFVVNKKNKVWCFFSHKNNIDFLKRVLKHKCKSKRCNLDCFNWSPALDKIEKWTYMPLKWIDRWPFCPKPPTKTPSKKKEKSDSFWCLWKGDLSFLKTNLGKNKYIMIMHSLCS